MATARELNAPFARFVPVGGRTITVDFDDAGILAKLTKAVMAGLNQEALTMTTLAQEGAPVRKIFHGGQRANALEPTFRHSTVRSKLFFEDIAGLSRTLRARQLRLSDVGIKANRRRITGDFRAVKSVIDKKTLEDRIVLARPEANRLLTYRGRKELERANQSTFGTAKLPNTPLSRDEQADIKEQHDRYRADQARPPLLRTVPKPTLSIGTSARGKNISAVFQGRLGGRLKGEIYTEFADANSGDRLKAATVSPTPYARYVEFGTRFAAAQPYMRPALMHVRQTFRDELIRALAKASSLSKPSRTSNK